MKKLRAVYLIVHIETELILAVLYGRRHRGDAQLDALLVVRLRLHVLRQVALSLEGEVAVPAGVRTEVGMSPEVNVKKLFFIVTNKEEK
jgi:hypothetical protein